jgi:hypothetical protein
MEVYAFYKILIRLSALFIHTINKLLGLFKFVVINMIYP